MFSFLTLAKQEIEYDWGVFCPLNYCANNTQFTGNVVYKLCGSGTSHVL